MIDLIQSLAIIGLGIAIMFLALGLRNLSRAIDTLVRTLMKEPSQ